MIVALAFLLGGFGGCATMALRHQRRLGQIEGAYRARLAEMYRDVAPLVQADLQFNTHNGKAAATALNLTRELDSLGEHHGIE